LIVDAGNFSSPNKTFNKKTINKILNSFTFLHYDAINLSLNEFKQSWDYINEIKKEQNLPLVSANIINNKDSQPLVNPFMILEKTNNDTIINIGIFGLSQNKKVNIPDSIKIINPVDAAIKQIRNLNEKCDIIICLADLNMKEIKQLVYKCPEIDVVVQSGSTKRFSRPFSINNTIVVNAGTKGQYVGVLELNLNRNKEIVNHHGFLQPLDNSIPESPEIAKILNNRSPKRKISDDKKYKKISNPVFKNKYATALFCKSCHTLEYEQWIKSDHAHAFNSLKQKNQSQDKECIACHTTGYQKEGYVNFESTPQLINVQCESCHGPQINHINQVLSSKSKSSNYKIKHLPNVTEEICYKCHTSKTDPEFDFNMKYKIIEH